MLTFEPFPKIARLSRDIIITEKLDGTNAQIIITEEGEIGAASRTRLIVPGDDNYGFARWVADHATALLSLGPGRHFGEWWGKGIQRGYGLAEKHFSLFNVGRWNIENIPACVSVVPKLYEGPFDVSAVEGTLFDLAVGGSVAAPGFRKPEGVVIFHTASNQLFKKTIEKDEAPKGLTNG